MNREVPVIGEITPPSPFIDHHSKSSNTFINGKKVEKKDKLSSRHHLKSSFCSKYASSRHSNGYEVDKDVKVPKEVRVLKSVYTHFTTALDFINYRQQKQSQK